MPRAKVKPSGRKTPRQIVGVVAAFCAILALGLLATKSLDIVGTRAAFTRADDEAYTGSILFMPGDGTLCRQLLFDNRNGRFDDRGMVDCMTAQTQASGETPKLHPNARLLGISASFRGQ
jgi:hypothetical protein